MIYIIQLTQSLIMIFRHSYVNPGLCEGKLIKRVNVQDPLIVISEQKAFLTYTIEVCLRHNGVSFELKTISNSQLESSLRVIDHEAPILVFSQQILQKYQISEFLCDVDLGDDSLVDFMNRKIRISDTVEKWARILQFQRSSSKDFGSLSDLGVHSEKDYQNVVLEQFQRLALNYNGKLLSKCFRNYSDTKPCLENLLLVDILNCILYWAPNSYLDFYLRAYFSELLQLKQQIEAGIQQSPNKSREVYQILLEQPIRPRALQWQTFQLNTNKFLIAFAFTGLIYCLFVKQGD